MRKYIKALEKEYIGTMSVVFFDKEKLASGETIMLERVVMQDIPCKISNSYANYKNKGLQGDGLAVIQDDTARLFLSPDIFIPSGCQINVMQDGRSYIFKNTGRCFIYSTHQEIIIETYNYI